MTDPPVLTIPGSRRLGRASSVVKTNGQAAVKELDDIKPSMSPPTPTSQGGFKVSMGASLKKVVKVASNSLNRMASENKKRRSRKPHVRSFSEGTIHIHPPSQPIHSQSAPSHIQAPAAAAEMQSTLVESGQSQFLDMASPEEELSMATASDVSIPTLLQEGVPMTKVSSKKRKTFVFRLDADLGQIVWESGRHKIIPIENIKEIRSGTDARYYREQFQLAQECEDRWLTIIYILDGNYKTLHLVAATKDVFDMWDATLRKLHAIRQELMSGLGHIEVRQALWEKQYWKGADEEHDQKLTFDEAEKLCKRLNINSSRDHLFHLFKKADVQRRDYLEFADFKRFVKLLKARPEVERLYKKLRSQNPHDVFDFSVFEQFMREKQKSTLPQTELLTIFKRYAVSSHVDSDSPPLSVPTLTVDSFTSFLLSPDNSAFGDQHGNVWHDMTRPLSEYFISSSHNTYLIGHQLVGVSTIEGYIRALLHSCRSVELDIYDGDHEPMIFHGKTFTSKVSLRQVCAAIAKYGFVASPYPIIISAEVHCTVSQQDMIADIMIKVFGDALVRAPVNEELKIDFLPSPTDLMGKILFKTKNLNLQHDSIESDISLSDPSASSASDSEALQDIPEELINKRRPSDSFKELTGELLKPRPTVLQRVLKATRKSVSSTPPPVLVQSPPSGLLRVPSQNNRNSLTLSKSSSRPSFDSERPKPKMSAALLELLVYTVGVKCRGINKKEEYAPEHMFSLSENMANKMIKASVLDLIKHNRTHLVRTYPKGLRLNSTNYEPHRFWAAGAQLVALNWQTFDLGYMINHAMFQRNGRAGYVLKPAALRLPNKDLLAKRTKHTLALTIISAQQLPRPKDASGHEIVDKSIVDPFVEVTLHVPDWADEIPASSPSVSPGLAVNNNPATRRTTFRTSVVKNNGFNPVWEHKMYIPFTCVGDMKELIFVRFVVRQGEKDDDEPLAVYCASLGSLGHGYRHLPLHDSQLSQHLFSTLFVCINTQDIPF